VDDYHAGKYVFPVCIIAILQNYNGLFVNLFRVKNRLNSISVTQSLIVLFPFLTCFFFNGERLLEALVLSNLISFAACVVYSITSGVANRPSRNEVSLSCMKVILSKGILLFLYNSCFYFIILSIRTIVSDNYSIEDFGYFTFAFTLGNAILSLLDAVSFVVFPKVLSLFNSSDLVGVRRALVKIRSIYMISAHILVYFFILSMPLLTYVMPDYAQSVTAFNLIALALLMKSNSYAHSSLLVAKNKEGLSAIISAVGLVVNIAVGMILVKVFRVTFNYVAIATLLSYLVISAWTYIKGEIMLIGSMSLMEFVKDYFPLTLLIPYIVALIVTTLDLYWLFWLPLALVLVLNIKGIVSMIGFIRNILVKPDIINI
jgi:O-antigen/teichoic acid export membrane protein